ncbi:MAG: hypothetical protein LEGION0398_MBIBDBAK_00255 [Legionellaceae bacterium]
MNPDYSRNILANLKISTLVADYLLPFLEPETDSLIKALLKKTYAELFQWLLKNQFFLYKLQSGCEKKFFILMGTSSSGKTTLLSQIKKQWPDITCIECDVVSNNILIDILKKNESLFKELEGIFKHNLMYYLFCDKEKDPFWQKESKRYKNKLDIITKLDELKKTIIINDLYILNAISLKIKELVKMSLFYNKVVILDMLLSNSEYEALKELNPVIIGIYCDLARLMTNINNRNKKAEKENILDELRQPLTVYRQFSELYHACAEQGIDFVAKKKLLQLIDDAVTEYPYNLPKAYENPVQYKQLIMKNLGIDHKQKISIAPTFWRSTKKIIKTHENSLTERLGVIKDLISDTQNIESTLSVKNTI